MTITQPSLATGRPGALDSPAAEAAPTAPPRWIRPAVAVLLIGTAILYLCDLSASGWANAFYTAAVQAGTKSWKAFFFGSSDASNFITVDKTAGVAVGHGDLRAHLRRQLVEHPRAAGTRGRRGRRACSMRRYGAGPVPSPA